MNNNEESLLFKELKESYGVSTNTVMKTYEGFKELGIEEFEFLSVLTEILVSKKVSCSKKRRNKEKFIFDVCRQEAIDYFSKDNSVFLEKYQSLTSQHEPYDTGYDDYSDGNHLIH